MLAFQPLESLPHNHRDLTVTFSRVAPLEHPRWHLAEVTQEERVCVLRIAFPRLGGILLLLSTKFSGVYIPKR